jgi:hypothetical protein
MIGLRIGTGGSTTTEVYFDNIVVTDLSPDPTPEPTPFPYFSQRDPQWKDNRYDYTAQTIEDIGCALTGASMVLKSYGIKQVPWGDNLRELNPGTLNDWLNAQQSADKWWRQGSLNWQTMSTLSQALHASDSALYTKLAFKDIQPTQESKIVDILTTGKQPLIFKHQSTDSPSGNHFVVAYKHLTNTANAEYQINDPWNENNTTFSTASAQLRRVLYFYPTESDFSYLYLNADRGLLPLITDPQNRVTGIYPNTSITEIIPQSNHYLESPIAGHLNPPTVTGDSYWHTNIKEPATGKYLLQFNTAQSGFYRFELYAYNNENLSSLFNQSIFVGSNYPVKYHLTYFHESHEPVATFTKLTSFETLRQLIIAAYSQGWITRSQTRDQMLNHVDVAEKVYHLNHNLTVLRTIGLHNDNFYRQGKIIDPGYFLIKAEVNLLLSQL